jgi:hypothetical protein
MGLLFSRRGLLGCCGRRPGISCRQRDYGLSVLS